MPCLLDMHFNCCSIYIGTLLSIYQFEMRKPPRMATASDAFQGVQRGLTSFWSCSYFLHHRSTRSVYFYSCKYSFNLLSALYRCEILFFSTGSISAYLHRHQHNFHMDHGGFTLIRSPHQAVAADAVATDGLAGTLRQRNYALGVVFVVLVAPGLCVLSGLFWP